MIKKLPILILLLQYWKNFFKEIYINKKELKLLQSLKNIFAANQSVNIETNIKEIDLLSGLMIEAANTDGEVTQEELNKISHSLINVFKEDQKLLR